MSLAIGLNSGSSFDGLDAVLVELQATADGYPGKPRYIDGLSMDWPAEVGERVLAAFQNEVSMFEFTRLNYEVGAVFAEAAQKLMRQNSLAAADVTVIGYDGQTVYQEPPSRDLMAAVADDEPLFRRWHGGGYPVGLQIGEPSVVAGLCDVDTVTQFRPLEHALGGNAAPLMQFLDWVSFRDAGRAITLNIGGIANIQVVDEDRERMMAFDTGPGNIMIDRAMRELFGTSYDRDGATAARGTVDEALLATLLRNPFFDRTPPRSAWRLDFGDDTARRIIAENSHLSGEDIVATFTQFTAVTIAKAIYDWVPEHSRTGELIASGGGVLNATLLAGIREQLRPLGLQLTLSDEFGIPAQYKEAIKFAALAWTNVQGLANNIPAASGASSFASLGKLVRAPYSVATGGADAR